MNGEYSPEVWARWYAHKSNKELTIEQEENRAENRKMEIEQNYPGEEYEEIIRENVQAARESERREDDEN